jgi:putative ABC transport system substrate-binding protein
MASYIGRRRFLATLGGAAATWPLAAHAQQQAMPVVGFLNIGSADWNSVQVHEFRVGLSEAGFNEGQNVAIEFRWAQGHDDRLPALAGDLVERRVAVMVATGGNTVTLAAKSATASIPIVFTMGDDPVRLGIVSSVNRPGGNVTGASFYSGSLGPKRLELLRELVPKATSFAYLTHSLNPEAESQLRDVQAAANAMGQQLFLFDARSDNDIHSAYAAMAEKRVGALLLGTAAFLYGRMNAIVALAIRHAIPACYYERQFVSAGGLMSYGARRSDAYRQAGIYAGRILKGEKPGDLPIIFPSRFELVFNLGIARVIGVVVPPTLLARADEVIE